MVGNTNRDFKYLKQIGNKVLKARLDRGITQRKLSKMCDMNVTALCELEKGKRSCYILTLKTIADKLEMDIKDFL